MLDTACLLQRQVHWGVLLVLLTCSPKCFLRRHLGRMQVLCPLTSIPFKDYHAYMCTPMSFTRSAPAVLFALHWKFPNQQNLLTSWCWNWSYLNMWQQPAAASK
jgi:hypothetical protein